MGLRVEVCSAPAVLGEGPHWDAKNQCLYYVDLFGNAIHKYSPSKNKNTKVQFDDGPVTLIVPIEGSSDRFIITRGRKIYEITWDGESNKLSKSEELLEIEKEPGYNTNRFNDGKVDPVGRLWAGTMGKLISPGKFDEGKGSLYTLIGKRQVRNELGNLTISNGLAWDIKDRKMYFIDSPTRVVEQYDYNSEKGTISNKKIIFKLDDHNISGIPDGMTIDTNGKLWVAVYDGSCVLHICPKTSKLIQKIDMPTKQVTSVSFGGEHLDILYVTTAALPVDNEKPKEPAGCLFKITGTGCKGFPGTYLKYDNLH